MTRSNCHSVGVISWTPLRVTRIVTTGKRGLSSSLVMASRQKAAKQLGELALIARIQRLAPSRNKAVRVGIGDDCAVLNVAAGHEIVVTTDFSLEGRHFRRDWHSAESAGHRCMARGLSDIAAMGAKPFAAFLSLALSGTYSQTWVDGFLRAFNALAAQHGVQLAGGDTAQAPGIEILADVTVMGSVAKGKALLRSTARAGDSLYVTGSLGGSAAELCKLAAGAISPRRPGRAGQFPQSFPAPRVDLGLALARRGLATACMDLSDGLSTDLNHLCRASGVSALVYRAALPVAAGASLEQALHGGEDYELLFTARAATRIPRAIDGICVTKIGEILPRSSSRSSVRIGDSKKSTSLKPQGWQHLVS